jgi:hypothetical protein
MVARMTGGHKLTEREVDLATTPSYVEALLGAGKG